MKSPCFDCRLKDEDKNESVCAKCDDRYNYVNGLNTDVFKIAVPKSIPEKEVVCMKKGICSNCKREDVGIAAKDLCWVCYEAANTARKKDVADYIALAEIRKRLETEGVLKSGQKKKKAPPIETEPKTANIIKDEDRWVEPVVRPEPFASVCLNFKEKRDQELLNWLNDFSVRSRRTLEQEILKILDTYMAFEKSQPGPGGIGQRP